MEQAEGGDGQGDAWRAASDALTDPHDPWNEVFGPEEYVRRALLTLILAGSPEMEEHASALQQPPIQFEPLGLAEALYVLAYNHASERRRPLLRPMLTKNLVRLAINHPEFVTTQVEGNAFDAAFDTPGSANLLPNGELLSVRQAIDQVHLALLFESGQDGDGYERIGAAFDGLRDASLRRQDDPDNGDPPLDLDRTEELRPVRDPSSQIDQDVDLRDEPMDEPYLPHTDDDGSLPPTIDEVVATDPSFAAVYYQAVATALGIDTSKVTPPACSDWANPDPDGAHEVIAQWTTKDPMDALVKWLVPTEWPGCSKGFFFRSMTMVPSTDPAPDGEKWAVVCKETVLLLAHTLVTDLSFTHFTEKNGTIVKKICTTYDLPALPEQTPELSHDNGKLELVRVADTKTGEVRTTATVTKKYRFTTPSLDGYAELACDTWWGELAIVMSTNCGQGYSPYP